MSQRDRPGGDLKQLKCLATGKENVLEEGPEGRTSQALEGVTQTDLEQVCSCIENCSDETTMLQAMELELVES